MKFSDIIGHETQKEELRLMADTGRVPHAILFSGPSGIGKYRTALAFAQYLHCKNPQNGEACGRCPSCLQHEKYNNPDLHFIYPIVKKEGALISKDMIEPWKEMLKENTYMQPELWNELLKAGNSQTAIFVNESEEILLRASLSSFQEDLKIFILWLPEKLRPEAANKLLKIVEEPHEDTVFILVTNDESLILPTILSRTRRLSFHPLSPEKIEILLIENGLEKSQAKELAAISGGSISKALEFLYHPEEINEFSEIFKDIMRSAYALNARHLKELSEEISAYGREKLIRFLLYMAHLIRENYIFNFGIKELNRMTKDEESFSVKFSPFIHQGNVEDILNEIGKASLDISRNGNSKIVIFDLFLLLSRFVRKPK